MTDKQIIDKVNVKECEYYCNGKCERYEEFVEADYTNYSVKCICEKENDLGTYDICDYQQLKAKEQECKWLEEEKLDRQNALTEMINILYPNADDDELFTAVFNGEYIDKLKEVVEQLKGKEQECERLDNEAQNLFTEKTNLSIELDQLKAENEEFKDLNTRLDNQRETYWKEYQKLKQTLAEIKEIAEENDELLQGYHKEWANNKQILQKISEVGNV